MAPQNKPLFRDDSIVSQLVAAFAFFFLDERPSVREWTGILMVGGGVLLLALKR